MASTGVIAGLTEPVDAAKRKIADAVVQLLSELPPGVTLDSVMVHLVHAQVMGQKGASTRLDGITISIGF